MPEKYEDIIRALKLKTKSKTAVLTLNLDNQKYLLPNEVRVLATNEYVFVHMPPSVSLLRICNEQVQEVVSEEEVLEAFQSIKKNKKKLSEKSNKASIPKDLEEALKQIPEGYKVAYGANGSARLVRSRSRKKKTLP